MTDEQATAAQELAEALARLLDHARPVQVVEQPDEVLTVDQAAKLLGFSTDRVYTALRDGELPGLRVGNKWRLSKRALLDAMAQRQRQAS